MNKQRCATKAAVVSAMMLFICLGVYCFCLLDTANFNNVQLTSVFGLIVLAFIILSWRRKYHRILSPYIVFSVTLYLTLCGQTIPWAFGARAGYRDLTLAVYNGLQFSDASICRALLFSYLCLLTTHVVVINKIDCRSRMLTYCPKENEYANDSFSMIKDYSMYRSVVLVGLVLTVVSAIPYFASSFTNYVSISVSGYGSQYENVSYGINSLMSKIGEFFPVGAITLLYAWGKKNNYNSNNFGLKFICSYLIIASYLVMELMLSQRTGVLLFAIALLFIYFPHKKIPKFLVFCAAGAALLMMAGMRMVDLLRSGNIQGIADFLTYFGGDSNPVLDFLGDLGWNLMTTIEFQEIMPQARPFGYGFSYIISLTSAIPNLNFWDIHPATAYGNISAWLQNYLGFSFGIGCTPVAEAYYNFGDWGWLVFILWGKFMVYLTKKFEDTTSIHNNYCVVLFMGILLKSVVRSSFYAVFRPYIFYVVIPIALTKILYNMLQR